MDCDKAPIRVKMAKKKREFMRMDLPAIPAWPNSGYGFIIYYK